MATHTPTPWKVIDGNIYDPKHCEEVVNGHRQGLIALPYGHSDEAGFHGSQAQAEFIVTAVNAHDDLIAALETLSEQVRSRQVAHQCPGFDCATCTPVEALSNAETLLAKVKT